MKKNLLYIFSLVALVCVGFPPYTHGIYPPSGCGDADALLFITNSGITDDTEKDAVCQLVIDMKAYGIWTKMKAVYPFVGSTATTTAYNLKSPYALATSFSITWNGTVTHSSMGVQGNGTTGYGNTNLSPLDSLQATNLHLSYYSRTNNPASADMIDLGSFTGSPSNRWVLFRGEPDGGWIANQVIQLYPGGSVTRTDGFFVGSKESDAVRKIYHNGVLKNTNTTATTVAYPQFPIFIMSVNNTLGSYSTRQYAFVSIGDGLSETEVGYLTTCVVTFVTALGRNV